MSVSFSECAGVAVLLIGASLVLYISFMSIFVAWRKLITRELTRVMYSIADGTVGNALTMTSTAGTVGMWAFEVLFEYPDGCKKIIVRYEVKQDPKHLGNPLMLSLWSLYLVRVLSQDYKGFSQYKKVKLITYEHYRITDDNINGLLLNDLMISHGDLL